MKHYISLRGSHLSYMKDRAITYSLLCRKRRIAWSGEMEAGDGKLRESMKKLAVKYRLKGKKASLVLDAPVRSAFMTLPGAGPGELEAMARNRVRGLVQGGRPDCSRCVQRRKGKSCACNRILHRQREASGADRSLGRGRHFL